MIPIYSAYNYEQQSSIWKLSWLLSMHVNQVQTHKSPDPAEAMYTGLKAHNCEKVQIHAWF